jgi:hypothetical protein
VLNWRAVDVQMDLVTVVANGIGFIAFPTVGAAPDAVTSPGGR